VDRLILPWQVNILVEAILRGRPTIAKKGLFYYCEDCGKFSRFTSTIDHDVGCLEHKWKRAYDLAVAIKRNG